MNDITITITPEQGVFLLESLDWSLQATEKSLQRRDTPEVRTKWQALDDIVAQMQECKRAWYAPGDVA